MIAFISICRCVCFSGVETVLFLLHFHQNCCQLHISHCVPFAFVCAFVARWCVLHHYTHRLLLLRRWYFIDWWRKQNYDSEISYQHQPNKAKSNSKQNASVFRNRFFSFVEMFQALLQVWLLLNHTIWEMMTVVFDRQPWFHFILF